MNTRLVGIIVLAGLGLGVFLLRGAIIPQNGDGNHLTDSSATVVTTYLSKDASSPTDITNWENLGLPVSMWYNSSSNVDAIKVELTITYPTNETVDFTLLKTWSGMYFGQWFTYPLWGIPSHIDVYTFTFTVSTLDDQTVTDVFYAKVSEKEKAEGSA